MASRRPSRRDPAAQRSHAGVVTLRVLDDARSIRQPRHARLRRLRRLRTVTLIVVHVLIIGHIIHWLIAGRTMAPVVLSESMRTLERGAITPGFLLFVAAIATTLLFGRFFCGWACHMGALQDLAAWALRRVGLRPRPFRSRLLGYLPMALAFYMFVWPTARRELLLLVERWLPGMADSTYTPLRPGLGYALTTEQFWQGLPGLWVAIPFLLVCGVATVWFLGTRGLCRFGCPYGGIFAPIDRLSIGRIVMDSSRCDQCGLCTAACGNDVRVHEETAQYGRIVSARCAKTMDCVAICPGDALSFRFAPPSLSGKRAIRLYDLSLGEEVLVLAVFAGAFFVTRGLYELVPMLMAFSIGLCAAFLAWQCLRLVRDANCKLAGGWLKRGGRMTVYGTSVAALAAGTAVLLVHSTAVRAAEWTGGQAEKQVVVSRAEGFAGGSRPPEVVRAARRALWWYDRAGWWREGGLGLAPTGRVALRSVWLQIVIGEYASAAKDLDALIERSGARDDLCADLGRTLLLAGRPDEAVRTLATHVRQDDSLHQTRGLLTELLIASGRLDEAAAVQEHALRGAKRDPSVLAALASIRAQQDRLQEASSLLREACSISPSDGRLLHDLAVVHFLAGDAGMAVDMMREAAAMSPQHEALFLERAREMARAADMTSTDGVGASLDEHSGVRSR